MGVTIPLWLYSLNVFGYDTSILTVLYVILCTYIVTLGSKESNVFNYTFTVAKLGTLLLISFMALTYMNVDNYIPFVLEEKGGWSGTIQGASVIYFAYLGFDFITCLAEETRNPI
jgi:APA family basic amino acid/polyamine antiporter